MATFVLKNVIGMDRGRRFTALILLAFLVLLVKKPLIGDGLFIGVEGSRGTESPSSLFIKGKPPSDQRVSGVAASKDKKSLPTIKVTAFGAKGDGKTDDTAAIQAAVYKAGASGGGIVYFPKGVYLVSGTILVAKNKVTLEGSGWDAELRMMRHPKRVIEIRGSTGNAVRSLQVSLGVQNAVRNDEDEGIYISSQASDFVIEKVLGNAKGIMTRGGTRRGLIRNNTIRGTLADGIHVTGGSSDIRVENNDLQATGDDAIAVVSYRYQQAFCENIVIKGNRINNSAARGIVNAGGSKVIIKGNTIEGTSSSGILTVQDTNYGTFEARDTLIQGNHVEEAGYYGTRLGNQFGIEIAPGSLGVSIGGNTVTRSYTRGISIAASQVIVRNNRIERSGGSGLDLKGDSCIIANNWFETNGGYGLVASKSKALVLTDNHFVNNNEADTPSVDNVLLEDTDDAVVRNNDSSETRDKMRVERTYELAGSCTHLVYENNKGTGTLLGEGISCKP